MRNYQDMVTGQIYAFEDDYDPFLFDNRFIPKTRTKNIKKNRRKHWFGMQVIL